jgi:uncharacterized protein
MIKTTLVLGASPNPARYSYRAVRTLQCMKIPVVAVGRREFDNDDLKIIRGKPLEISPVHTVTLYLNSTNQIEYYDYILALDPKRVIFNPGTANPEFAEMLKRKGIEVMTDCTLVMLECGRF